MDVTMAVVAREAGYAPSGLGGRVLNISGVVDHVRCDELPCAIGRICVAVGFSADAREAGTQQTIRVRLTEPDGTILGELENPYTVPESPLLGRWRNGHVGLRSGEGRCLMDWSAAARTEAVLFS